MVESMINGSEAAFDELYRSYSGKLYRMAYFITGNRSDSEDILQETFVKCFLYKSKLKQADRFEPWLYQILVRTAWRLERKKKRKS
uniref:RNA polymerase sigma factor n=1 Tax=Clostridium sp. NkU-1 TaxID=1095009 RepID=UPI003261BA42